jgi:hypothetical protein
LSSPLLAPRKEKGGKEDEDALSLIFLFRSYEEGKEGL